VGDPPRWPRDTTLSTKVGTKFRRQVAVDQSVEFARGLRATEFAFCLFVHMHRSKELQTIPHCVPMHRYKLPAFHSRLVKKKTPWNLVRKRTTDSATGPHKLYRILELKLFLFISVLALGRPPLWPSGQSSWLLTQRYGFDSRRYQIFWVAVDLVRGPLSHCESKWGATWEKSSGSGLVNWD
jgi:hypothetical protein